MFRTVTLYKLQQTITNQLHHASYGVGGKQKHFYLVKKIKIIIIKKGKNSHLQTEIIK